MIRRTTLFLALAWIGFTGCSSSGTAEPFISNSDSEASSENYGGLQIGSEVSLDDLDVLLRFEDVLSDSRCPVDVTCIWEGNAHLSLSIVEATGGIIKFNLNTSPNAVTDDGQIRFPYRGYDISIAQLLPEPRSDREIRPDEYRLEIVTSRR